jgi:WD40 repeat protein
VRCVALARDGSIAAIGVQSGTVRLTRVPSGGLVHEFQAHAQDVDVVAFRGDGRYQGTASRDRTLRLWALGAGRPRELLASPSPTGSARSVSFRPDGSRLSVLVRGEPAVRVWHLDRLRERLTRLGLGWAEPDRREGDGRVGPAGGLTTSAHGRPNP